MELGFAGVGGRAAVDPDQILDQRATAPAAGAGPAGAADVFHALCAALAGVQDPSVADLVTVTDQHVTSEAQCSQLKMTFNIKVQAPTFPVIFWASDWRYASGPGDTTLRPWRHA